MTKPSPFSLSKNPGLVLLITYLLLFVINSTVLYLANLFFPTQVVLGTHALTPFWAIVLSMGTLSLFATFAVPLVRLLESYRGKMATTVEWMLYYAILNFAVLWFTSRYSQVFGFGITSFYIALALAVILDFLQGLVMMKLEKLRA